MRLNREPHGFDTAGKTRLEAQSDIWLSCCVELYEIMAFFSRSMSQGGSVAEWLVCWTEAQKGPGSNRSHEAVG